MVHCADLELRSTPPSATVPYSAYKPPIMMKEIAMRKPPMIRGLRRPHRSTQICAGIVHIIITMPVTPDARKDARLDAKPAC